MSSRKRRMNENGPRRPDAEAPRMDAKLQKISIWFSALGIVATAAGVTVTLLVLTNDVNKKLDNIQGSLHEFGRISRKLDDLQQNQDDFKDGLHKKLNNLQENQDSSKDGLHRKIDNLKDVLQEKVPLTKQQAEAMLDTYLRAVRQDLRYRIEEEFRQRDTLTSGDVNRALDKAEQMTADTYKNFRDNMKHFRLSNGQIFSDFIDLYSPIDTDGSAISTHIKKAHALIEEAVQSISKTNDQKEIDRIKSATLSALQTVVTECNKITDKELREKLKDIYPK